MRGISKKRSEENWSQLTYVVTLFVLGALITTTTGSVTQGFIFAVTGAWFASRWRPHLFPSALDRAAVKGSRRVTRFISTLVHA
jgi:hypothetical protein